MSSGVDTQWVPVFSEEVPALLPFVACLEKNHVYLRFFLFSLSCSAFHIKESSLMAVHGKHLWIYAFADGVGQMEI